MIIDYYILHYNRPYFAEAHVSLARKYFPFVRNFILLDDGSDKNALEILKNKFSSIVSNDKNVNNWKNGSVGDLFNKAFLHSDADMIMFAEDDFFPCPYYIDDSDTENDFISPDVVFNAEATIHGLNSSCFELLRRKEAMMSMARSNYGWKAYRAKRESEGLLEIDTSVLKRVYSNWPWVMPSSLAKKIFINLIGKSIWQIESAVDENLRVEKKENLKLYAPRVKNFIHVGFLCSTRKEDFNGIGVFNENRKKAINKFSDNTGKVNLDEIRHNLLQRYLCGKKIDTDVLYSVGLHECLKEFAFS